MWKYAIDSALEHEFITVKVSGKLTGDKTTGYKGEVIFDPYITSNFGWLAGKIKQTVDYTNHIITFSAEAATEISGMLQDGWTPVYIVDNQYYTTTTPGNVDSLKQVSSSDNIENLLICGYYTIDEATNKLVATEPTTNIGPVSNKTKNYQNKYITTVDHAFVNAYVLMTVDVSNATTIGGAFFRCNALTVVDISNATSIYDDTFFSCDNLQYVILNNTTPPSNNANNFAGCKLLIPSSSLDTYKTANGWASYADYFDAIENYNIDRTNCTITVTKKIFPKSLNFIINNSTDTIVTTAYVVNDDNSIDPTSYPLGYYDADTGEQHKFFKLTGNSIVLLLDTHYSSDALRILKSHDLKLEILHGEKVGGIFDTYEYTEGEEHSGFATDKITFSSYKNSNMSFINLLVAFGNGENLTCKIDLFKK